MGCRQICLQELYLRGQWIAHAWNSLCDIISHSTWNPIIPLSSLLPNLTSIVHLTPLHPIISFPYVPSSHPPSTSPSFLSAPSSSSNPSFNLPLLIIPFIPYLPPPHHPVFVLHPIPLTFISYTVIIIFIQTNYYSNFIKHLIISHMNSKYLIPMTPPP